MVWTRKQKKGITEPDVSLTFKSHVDSLFLPTNPSSWRLYHLQNSTAHYGTERFCKLLSWGSNHLRNSTHFSRLDDRCLPSCWLSIRSSSLCEVHRVNYRNSSPTLPSAFRLGLGNKKSIRKPDTEKIVVRQLAFWLPVLSQSSSIFESHTSFLLHMLS